MGESRLAYCERVVYHLAPQFVIGEKPEEGTWGVVLANTEDQR
jgi:hypothetical protein